MTNDTKTPLPHPFDHDHLLLNIDSLTHTHTYFSLHLMSFMTHIQSSPSPRKPSTPRPRLRKVPSSAALPALATVRTFPRRKSQPRKRASRGPRKLQGSRLQPLTSPRRVVGDFESNSTFPELVREMLEHMRSWKLRHMPAQVRTESTPN